MHHTVKERCQTNHPQARFSPHHSIIWPLVLTLILKLTHLRCMLDQPCVQDPGPDLGATLHAVPMQANPGPPCLHSRSSTCSTHFSRSGTAVLWLVQDASCTLASLGIRWGWHSWNKHYGNWIMLFFVLVFEYRSRWLLYVHKNRRGNTGAGFLLDTSRCTHIESLETNSLGWIMCILQNISSLS